MKILKLENRQKLVLKHILIFILAFFAIFGDILLQYINLETQLTISSILIFLIIGLVGNNTSLLAVTLINFILFFINGFNILTCIEALEIYYVWFLCKRNNKNILIQVLVFWIVLALPLIFGTNYIFNLNFNMESVFSILMIFMNRIFNALIGSMILEYTPLEKIMGKAYAANKARTLSNLLIYVCLSSIVVPVIIFSLATNSNNQKQISEIAVRDLKSASKYVSQVINPWTEDEKNNLKLKNPIRIYNLIEMLEMYFFNSDNQVNFYLVDLNNKVIANENSPDYMKNGLEWLKEGKLTEVDDNVYKWEAPKENRFIIRNYSKEYAYVYVTNVNDLKIVITVSGSVYINKSIDIYLNILNVLLPLSIFVGIFSIILKKVILNSISELISTTTSLPERLKNNETIIFKNRNIFEIDLIISNFQVMIDNLRRMIVNVEEANKKLQKSERMLFEQAHYDSLTGLPNRHYFFKYVNEVIKDFHINEIYKDKEGIAFFFMDLDKFKSINDNYGHSAGDELLKGVSNRMKNVLEEYDSSCRFVSRFGGDEFVIEFIYDNKDEVIELANKLVQAIIKPITIEGNELNPGTSIGICLYPEDGKDLESFFIKSDEAMYKAKNSGGNRFEFYN